MPLDSTWCCLNHFEQSLTFFMTIPEGWAPWLVWGCRPWRVEGSCASRWPRWRSSGRKPQPQASWPTLPLPTVFACPPGILRRCEGCFLKFMANKNGTQIGSSTLFSPVAPSSAPCSAMRRASRHRSYSCVLCMYRPLARRKLDTASWILLSSFCHLDDRVHTHYIKVHTLQYISNYFVNGCCRVLKIFHT